MIRLGDGMEGLALVTNQGQDPVVDLVLTDLPSGETRAVFDKPVDLTRFFAVARAALEPKGVIVCMCSSLRFAAEVREAGGKLFRHDLIWEKTIATGFLNATKAPLRAHEFVLVFGRPGHYFKPEMTEGHGPINSNSRTKRGTENYGAMQFGSKARAGATDRYPRSVLHFPSVATRAKERKHPQQKPEALLRSLIRQYCPRGGIVIDPFAGSGSTVRAAEREGCEAFGWDIDPRFGQAC